MRRRLLILGVLLSACSLVYGIHDNLGPVDSGPDSGPEAAAPNGCPAEAGAHTFCEFFDETPSWPADAQMAQITGSPTLVGPDAGCPSPPHCLAATGNNTRNSVDRAVATAGGVHRVTYAFQARFDLVDSGTIPRVAWIELHGAAGVTTFGVTFAHDMATDDYWVWMFGVAPGNTGGEVNVVLLTLDVWYDLTLTIDLDSSSVELKSVSPAGDLTRNYVQEWGMPALAPASVTSVVVGGGVDTGIAHNAATIDSVTFDWN